MNKFFKISERGSTIRTEIFGGLTTFFAMAYIIFVNPNQIAAEGANGWLAALGANSDALGAIWNSVYVASVLVAFIGTMLYALYANLPYAQACGMGLNAFFCTTFVAGSYFANHDITLGYHAGLVIIFLSGLVFMILSVTGARAYIAKAMPDCLKKAIPAGIGLFIAFIGLQGSKVITANQYTLVQFFDFKKAFDAMGGSDAAQAAAAKDALIGVCVALLGFIIIAILSKLKVKGSILIGVIASAVLYYLFSWKLPDFSNSISATFTDFGKIGITGIFSGEAWKAAFNDFGGIFNAIMLIITFCLVDMFDTIGTLYGTASQAGMLDKNGDPVDINKAMTCDSAATVAGAVLGTSTCTTFVESSAGVAEGARTGLASLVTAVCLLLCLFISPIAAVIPACATAPALIYVGVLMASNFGQVDMTDVRSAVPAFLALIMMPLTYSISNGIGIGAIAYVLISLFTGNYKKRDITITVIALAFVLRFVFISM